MNNKRNIILAITMLVLGLLAGWLIFGNNQSTEAKEHENEQAGSAAEETTYTCSMHPQIRKEEQGDCPICGMELIPVDEEDSGEGVDASAISMSETAMQLADVRTAFPAYEKATKTIQLDGITELNEKSVFRQTSHIPGRVEKLETDFTGAEVKKGEVIALVYSPELVTAQEELLEAAAMKKQQPAMFQAAKEKLKNWRITQSQINEIIEKGEVREVFPVQADFSGTVTRKWVKQGDYVDEGEKLFEISDLSGLWVMFDLYESDLQWLEKGDQITFKAKALPGKSFQGDITFIDPLLDARKRVSQARVEITNEEKLLKPGMFVKGTADAEIGEEKVLQVPESAVMWTGPRSVVYVKNTSENAVNFMMREVELGAALGDRYIIREGLTREDEIAVNGVFSIDAAAQLAGKPSMMNKEGGETSTGHDHGSMSSDQEGHAHKQETHQSSEPNFSPEDVSETFKAQLTAFYEAYLEMKDAMVASEGAEAQKHAQEAMDKLDEVDMSLLEQAPHMKWMELLEALEDKTKSIANQNDLGTQREAFIDLNKALYEAVKYFGLKDVKTYYQYCPMANNDQGAYWFSNEEEIRNPYYGDMMLKCGEVEEVFENK